METDVKTEKKRLTKYQIKRLIKRKQTKKTDNKAGYTADTSCGRVGRGGNVRFHTFQLDYHDRRTDIATDRIACPQLKR